MTRGLLLAVVLMAGCGGEAFAPVSLVSTLPDARQEPTEVDATDSPSYPAPDGGADMLGKGDGSGSVEASADTAGGAETGQPPSPEASPDDADDANDAWPSDVVVVPWCPDSEFFPAYSITCNTWGQMHGWTLEGCCLPDHTCGTAYSRVPGIPRTCNR